MIVWHTKHSTVQKYIKKSVESQRYTASQLRWFSGWCQTVSAGFFIGASVGMISLIATEKFSTHEVFFFSLVLFFCAILFGFWGLCDSEAASIKAEKEKMQAE